MRVVQLPPAEEKKRRKRRRDEEGQEGEGEEGREEREGAGKSEEEKDHTLFVPSSAYFTFICFMVPSNPAAEKPPMSTLATHADAAMSPCARSTCVSHAHETAGAGVG